MDTGLDPRFHESRIGRLKIALVLAMLAAAAGCSLQSFEYLQIGESNATGGKRAAAGGRNGGGTEPGAGTSSSSEAGAAGTIHAGSGGSSPTGGGTTGASGSNGTLPPPCIGPWEFNSAADAAAWQPAGLSIPAGSTTSWNAEGENDPLGSLVCTATGVLNIQVDVPATCADLSHRKAYFRAKSASGPMTIKPYAMSTGWKWADNGEQPINPTTWTTVTMDFDNPAYLGVDYDQASIIIFGAQLPCPSTAASPQTWVAWIDRIWLE